MGDLLYYSRYDKASQRILSILSKSTFQDQIHFLCVDRRHTQPDGQIFITLDNGQSILLPPNITRVPALLLLDLGGQVLFGNEIIEHYRPNAQRMSTQTQDEPMTFALSGYGCGLGDVVSDSYSYLDIPEEEMQAKGNGGLYMMESMNQCFANEDFRIKTPADTYKPDKVVDPASVDKIRQQRDQEIPRQHRRT